MSIRPTFFLSLLIVSLVPFTSHLASQTDEEDQIVYVGPEERFREPVVCNASLTGEITKESVAEVISALDRLPPRFPGESAVLCLDSSGGSVSAASDLLKYFSAELEGMNGISTFVPDGAECGSSCALILLGGFTCSIRFCHMDRYVHAHSYVWFHSPFITLSGNRLPASIGEDLFDAGLQTILTILSPLTKSEHLDEDVDLRLTAEMLAIILGTPGTEKYEIRTVGDLARFKLNVVGRFQIPELTPTHVVDACNNAMVFAGTFSERARDLGEPEIKFLEDLSVSRVVEYYYRSWDYCSFSGMEYYGTPFLGAWGAIDTMSTGEVTLASEVSYDRWVQQLRSVVRPSHAWLFYSGDTLISSIVE